MIQQEHFGVGSTKRLRDILLKNKVKNIFLVSGKRSYKSCGAKAVIEKILTGYNFIHFCNFDENPKLTDVTRGIFLYKKNNIDLVIAVGGGSVIDMAKLINIFSCQCYRPEDYIYKTEKIKYKGKPLIAIPTTAGTGSESTCFAVVYVGKAKHSIAHDYILPDIAIIDPQFTFNLPSNITAATGMDVLCQAIESYWSVNSTRESKRYSQKAIKLVLKNLYTAVNRPSLESRIKMSKAANLAGKAINIAKTTAPHALSYAITSYFGASHGQAVALTLPEFLVYNYEVTNKDVVDKRGVKYVKKTIHDLNILFECGTIYKSKKKFLALMESIGLTSNFSKIGIKKKSDIHLIINNVNVERLSNNPRMLNKKTLEEILEKLI